MKTYLYFFFKAEDGIRDADVTGVQTCALPIYTTRAANPSRTTCSPARSASRPRSSCRRPSRRASAGCRKRSEERRGGKEGRSRWSSYHLKKEKRLVTVGFVRTSMRAIQGRNYS